MSFLDIFDVLFSDDYHCDLCNNRKCIKVLVDGVTIPNHQYRFLDKIPINQIGTDFNGKFYIPCPSCNIKVKNKMFCD